MHIHKWFFSGKVIKVIDDQTLELWLDLGFGTWKRIISKFNRLKSKIDLATGIVDANSTINFLEQNIKGKTFYFRMFRKKDQKGYEKYFCEIYAIPSSITIKLRDVNIAVSSSFRLDGFINVNDVLVSQGLAAYYQFETNHDKIPVHNRHSREYTKMPNTPEISNSKEN